MRGKKKVYVLETVIEHCLLGINKPKYYRKSYMFDDHNQAFGFIRMMELFKSWNEEYSVISEIELTKKKEEALGVLEVIDKRREDFINFLLSGRTETIENGEDIYVR